MTIETSFSGRDVELVPGFLRGYRAWGGAVREGQSPALCSTAVTDYVWVEGRNTAYCNNLRIAERWGVADSGPLFGCACVLCRNSSSPSYRTAMAQKALERLEAHGVPSSDCPECNQCGFYALHTVGMFGDIVHRYIPQPRPANLVFGTIKATGRVIIGEFGFRAQYAEIEALAGDHAKPFAETYNVPWIPGGPQELAEAFPPTRVEGVDYDHQSREDVFDVLKVSSNVWPGPAITAWGTATVTYATTPGVKWGNFWGVDPAGEQTE